MALNPRLNDPDAPLVSIVIFNYNYGRYLRECFDSVLAQTYDNVEINFSDNASTDDSWEIALEYQKRHPEQIFIARNRQNFGIDANYRNAGVNIRGKYFVGLCSDDALKPEYVKTCVEALEKHLDTGFAIVHRTIIDKEGAQVDEPSFYDRTCKIPGASQAAVYMMSSVSPSQSQVIYRAEKVHGKTAIGGLAHRWMGNRIIDFNMSCEHPVIYIKEPLLLHRIHGNNDALNAADNLMEIIGPYVINHQFSETAGFYGHKNVADRLADSIEKVSSLSLRYCVRALLAGNERNATRYFNLAKALHPEISASDIFIKIDSYWRAEDRDRIKILESLLGETNLVARTVSYSAPPGSIPI